MRRPDGASTSPRCPCGAATGAAHPRTLDGADLCALRELDPTGLATMLLDATDVISAGHNSALLVVCDDGRAQLGACLDVRPGTTTHIDPLLTATRPAPHHVRTVLGAAAYVAQHHHCHKLRLSVLATDLDVRRVAEQVGFELSGAATTRPRPELGLAACDTWTLTRSITTTACR